MRRPGAGSTYKFDGHLLVVEQIGAFENDTKGALADLLAYSVVDTDDIAAGGRHYWRLGCPLRTEKDEGDGVGGRWCSERKEIVEAQLGSSIAYCEE